MLQKHLRQPALKRLGHGQDRFHLNGRLVPRQGRQQAPHADLSVVFEPGKCRSNSVPRRMIAMSETHDAFDSGVQMTRFTLGDHRETKMVTGSC